MKAIDVRHSIPACLAACIVCFAAQDAWAYRYWTCNDVPNNIEEGETANYKIRLVSLPKDGSRYRDAVYSFKEWNYVYGMDDKLTWSDKAGNALIYHDDDISELYYKTNLKNGKTTALGVTYTVFSSCTWSWSESDIVEADIALRNNANTFGVGEPACSAMPALPGQRTTMIHEMGHGLGLDHEDRAMTLMMTSAGEGVYCRTHGVAPHPDDSAGGRHLYGNANAAKDLGASEFMWTGNNKIGTNTASGTTDMCPGEEFNFRWSMGNLGKAQATHGVSFYLYKLDGTPYMFLKNIAANVQAKEKYSTRWEAITIPALALPGTYTVGTYLDPSGQYVERFETNNLANTQRRINVKSAQACQ